MENLDLTQYINKTTGDTLSADMWNTVFKTILDKVNEVIADLSTVESKSLSALIINNELYTDSIITLQAGKTYKIEGTLNGQIIIDATTQPSDDTFIRLNGVTITTDLDSAILYKTPVDNQGYKGLTITLARNSINTIISNAIHDRTDDLPGAIYSMNNMAILGSGYLSVISKGGHGIRATELRLSGPHIYAEAVHDAIHAGKLLIIDDGYYYINKGNDAFGVGSTGNIMVYGGHFTAYNLEQYVFNSKGITGYYLNDLDINSEYANNNMLLLTFTEGSVLESDTEDGVFTDVALGEDNTYTLTKAVGKVVGKITNPIICPIAKTNLLLLGAYIETNDNAHPSVYYNVSSSRLKIKTVVDTTNIIKNLNDAGDYDSDGIKSENNITLELKSNSYLYVTSTSGDGVDGGTVLITDGSGTLAINKCGLRGIKGNTIVPGPNCEVTSSVITSYYTDPTDTENYSTFDGAIIVKNNHTYEAVGADTATSGYADIFCRNGKATKGYFGTTDNELRGVLIVGSIAAVNELNLAKADNIYASLIINPKNGVSISLEDYYVTPINKLPINY